MSTEENVQLVKNFFAAMGSCNARDLLALAAEDIEWIIPSEGWPLAGTHRGHAELAAVLKKASEEVETQYPKPPEFVAQGDRVMVVGVATGKIKATNRPFKDEWVFDITVRHGKVARIQEYIDTQALVRASQMDASRACVALALCSHWFGVDGVQPWVDASHAVRSSYDHRSHRVAAADGVLIDSLAYHAKSPSIPRCRGGDRFCRSLPLRCRRHDPRQAASPLLDHSGTDS